MQPRKFLFADVPLWLRKRFSDGQRFVILCALAGLLCGLAAVGFHFSIDILFEWVLHFANSLPKVEGILFLILSPAVGGLIVGVVIYRWAPGAVGSGIPQTKAAYYNHFGFIDLKQGFWRFLLGTIYVGSGNALGREGPTVHMCAAIASKLGQWAGLAKARVQAMVPVGMAAGIAAAFNTPLAAITFVFEELLDDFSTKALGGILIAVVIAAVIERSILGHNPIFSLHFPSFETDWWMLVSIVIGFLAGGIGHLFVSSIVNLRAIIREKEWLPVWLRPAIGGLGCGLIATGIYMLINDSSVFSIGYGALNDAFDGALNYQAFFLLFLGKMLVVVVCYSTGGSGGLFSPTIFCGGMLGGMCGVAMVSLFHLSQDIVGACVLLGMGAFFAAVIRCPMTSMLIIFEMTLNYSLILPLMAGNMLAYFLASNLRSVPLYDALLVQDKVTLRKMPSYQGAQDYESLPIKTIMTHDLVTVRAEDAFTQALDSLEGKTHHGFPVVNRQGSLVGMIMLHEIFEQIDAESTATVGEFLQGQRLISVCPSDSIRQVVADLIREDVLQVPVVSKNQPDRLLGIVTLHDIARQQNAITEQIGR